MKAQSILLVTVLFLAAGCAGPKPPFYWYHPEKTFQEVRADYSECERKAREEAEKAIEDRYFDHLRSPTTLGSEEEPPARRDKSADPGMQAKADWGELYKQKAFAGCMQGRGYVQLRPYQVSPSLKTKKLPLGAIAGK